MLLLGLQHEGRQGRREGQCVECRNEHRDGNGHGKLLEQRAGDAGQQRGGQEHGGQHQGNGHHRAAHFLHGGKGGLARGHAVFHVCFHGFHHHDGVVHHQADGQHHAEQTDGVEREAQHREEDEGGHQGHRHGNERDERGAPALQEDEYHQCHQHHGFKERVGNFGDGVAHGGGGIQGYETAHAFRHNLGFFIQQGFHSVNRCNGVGTGSLVDGDGGAGAAVDSAGQRVALGAKLNLRNIFQIHRLGALLAHNDGVELIHRGHAALVADGVGEFLAIGHGLGTHGTTGVDGVLRAHGIVYLAHRDSLLGHLVGVQPDTHGKAGTEYLHVAHAFYAFERVHQVQEGVAGETHGLKEALRGVQRIEHEGQAGGLLDGDAHLGHHGRQLAGGLAIAHVGVLLVGVGVGTGLEDNVDAA